MEEGGEKAVYTCVRVHVRVHVRTHTHTHEYYSALKKKEILHMPQHG